VSERNPSDLAAALVYLRKESSGLARDLGALSRRRVHSNSTKDELRKILDRSLSMQQRADGLAHRHRLVGDAPLHIFARLDTGKNLSLETHKMATVLHVKLEIWRRSKYPVDEQLVTHQGSALIDNDLTLAACGIRIHVTLHVRLMGPGGSTDGDDMQLEDGDELLLATPARSARSPDRDAGRIERLGGSGSPHMGAGWWALTANHYTGGSRLLSLPQALASATEHFRGAATHGHDGMPDGLNSAITTSWHGAGVCGVTVVQIDTLVVSFESRAPFGLKSTWVSAGWSAM
jgi:hypothetical protein